MTPNSIESEKENQQLRDKLAANQKALQDFVYAVSHDLGAPLRAVTGFSSILQNKYDDRLDEQGQTYLNFIAQAGTKAQQMLAGLLQYSRIDTRAKSFSPIDLTAVLEQVFEELRAKITAKAALIECESLPTVAADDDQMSQLLYAIVDNALTYQRPGILPHIRIHAEENGHFCKILVTDNGIGIAEENSERVFGIFKRLHADDVYPGVGMGLSIARHIIDRHEGNIGLRQEKPYGTTCWFTLPKLIENYKKTAHG